MHVSSAGLGLKLHVLRILLPAVFTEGTYMPDGKMWHMESIRKYCFGYAV